VSLPNSSLRRCAVVNCPVRTVTLDGVPAPGARGLHQRLRIILRAPERVLWWMRRYCRPAPAGYQQCRASSRHARWCRARRTLRPRRASGQLPLSDNPRRVRVSDSRSERERRHRVHRQLRVVCRLVVAAFQRLLHHPRAHLEVIQSLLSHRYWAALPWFLRRCVVLREETAWSTKVKSLF
jgi:hypothetical protein